MRNLVKLRGILKQLEKEVLASGYIETDADDSIRSLIRNLRDSNKTIHSVQAENKAEFVEAYGDNALILDYIIFLHLSFLLILYENFIIKNKSEVEELCSADASQKMHYLYLMSQHLVNSLYAVRLLVESGLDTQAKQVLRSYVEYSDIAIAILGNSEFYGNYKRMGDGGQEEKEAWYKYVRPSALTKILKTIYTNLDGSEEHWNIVQNIRDPMYSHLSEYSHGHFMAVFVGAFGDEDESVMLGRISERVDYTLIHAILYSYSYLKHSMILIVKDQDIPFGKFGSEGHKYIKHYKLLEHYIPKLIETWVGEPKGQESSNK